MRRALHVAVDVGNGETALLRLRLWPLRRHDLGIHERVGVALDVHHADALGAAHLRGREPDPVRGVHCREHVVEQPADLVGDFGDWFRLLAENGVTEYADGKDAHAAVVPPGVKSCVTARR